MSIAKFKETMGEFGEDAEFMDQVIKDMDLEEDVKVLDIGTGMGAMSILLALNGLDVLTGQPEVDPEWDDMAGGGHDHGGSHDHGHGENGHSAFNGINMDWRANARTLGVEGRITFQHLDAQKLEFPSGSFDAVFMYDALQHIPDRLRALEEAVRVLKDDGRLCVFEWNQETILRTLEEEGWEIDHVDPREILSRHDVRIDVLSGRTLNAFIIRRIV